MSGALAAVANISGVAFLSDFAAVSAPAATNCCTTCRLLLPGMALQQTVLTSAAVLVFEVSILHAETLPVADLLDFSAHAVGLQDRTYKHAATDGSAHAVRRTAGQQTPPKHHLMHMQHNLDTVTSLRCTVFCSEETVCCKQTYLRCAGEVGPRHAMCRAVSPPGPAMLTSPGLQAASTSSKLGEWR